jgi:hypothetical protein
MKNCLICNKEFKGIKYCSQPCAYKAMEINYKNKMVKPMFRVNTGIGGCLSNSNGQRWIYISIFIGYKRYYFVPIKWDVGNGKCELSAKNTN